MISTLVDRCDYRPGDRFENQFIVCKVLGEGSFGVVYLIKDDYGQQYALKVLRLWEVMAEMRPPLETRFKREFEVGQLPSANLVHAIQYGHVKGNPYIVMEFCDGGDLTPLLGKAGERFVPICRDILNGLKSLHDQDIVHRDLKPENVLFKHGVAALTDFGIAGDSKHRLTQRNLFGKPQQIFGTYAYMPPEQAVRARGGVTVQPTTDIYSFGVVAFQLLTGELPFGKLETPADLADYQRRSKEHLWNHRLLSTARGGDQWRVVLDGCLQPDPKQRIQNVSEVLRYFSESHSGSYYSETLSYGQQKSAPVQEFVSTPFQNAGTGASTSLLKARLRITEGQERGRIIKLDQVSRTFQHHITIGRGDTNNIILSSPASYVSRQHCTLQPEEAQNVWLLRDGQWNETSNSWRPSANGTMVNGRKITPNGFYLEHGDVIKLGDVTLIFETN